jgi:hypothetical protein
MSEQVPQPDEVERPEKALGGEEPSGHHQEGEGEQGGHGVATAAGVEQDGGGDEQDGRDQVDREAGGVGRGPGLPEAKIDSAERRDHRRGQREEPDQLEGRETSRAETGEGLGQGHGLRPPAACTPVFTCAGPAIAASPAKRPAYPLSEDWGTGGSPGCGSA